MNKKVNIYDTTSLVFLILLWILVDSVATRHLSSRVVTTKYGALRGSIATLPNRQLKPVEIFLGVPYATPPMGSLRFMPPVTPAHWKGVRNADQFGPVCPQRLPDITNETEALRRMPSGRLLYLRRLLPYLVNQSEDCLYLNIYAPLQGKRNFILLQKIYFLLQGLLEQMFFCFATTFQINFSPCEAVQAVSIERNKLTTIKEKQCRIKGILSVSGLFNRAILQSGSALSSWAIANDAISYTHHLANRLACPTKNNVLLVECMRQRPLSDIIRAQPKPPIHGPVFGPTVDGIVIPSSPSLLMDNSTDLYGHYDMLFGITRTEFYHDFSAEEEKSGIDRDRRDSFILSLLRTLYSSRLQEIFLITVSEYTDWTRPTQHPVNMMESTADILGDALFVAPIVRAGMFHSTVRSQSYLYVFTYQTESGEFSQRLGCIHGEELPYVFGVPLVGTLAHFSGNYTRSEISLAEAVMTFWTNFVKTGDPNSLQNEAESSQVQKAKGRLERSTWPPYEPLHQKYLTIGMKPKVRDHYHAHRLSFWNHLFPKLDRLGKTDYHHQTGDDHDVYDVMSRKFFPATSPSTVSMTTIWSKYPMNTEIISATSQDDRSDILTRGSDSLTNKTSHVDYAESVVVYSENSSYSTALSVTIAVGCSLLILNVLIFAGVFYQRDKTRMDTKLHTMNYEMKKADEHDKRYHAYQKTGQSLRVPPPSPVAVLPGCEITTCTGQNEILQKTVLQEKMPEAQPLLSQKDKVLWQPNQEMRYSTTSVKHILEHRSIGMKPKVRDHYHAHRLSFWNHLFPKLDRLGKTDYHHQTGDDHDVYDVMSRKFFPATSPSTVSMTTIWSKYPMNTEIISATSQDDRSDILTRGSDSLTNKTSHVDYAESVVVYSENSSYSTALSVTIAVGCSLLILNVLIFAGVFYQRDKTRMDTKLHTMNYEVNFSLI
ncbi:neuroligin-4, Y-linked-like [Centruroides sculpturatus]|uniref:neuroligin-4, Y-linked-like n=1 Tax=Centruroides sculpturatus TaxID=218467 RepID=UPI000C6E8FD7|nr:neuroligin-4, Y-linked-like [Centruroides sculpturatus]